MLSSLARQSAKSGESLVQSGDVFESTIEVARWHAQEELDNRLKRLQKRMESVSINSQEAELIFKEREFEEKVAQAVMTPSIRLEAIGLFVLAPFEPGEDSDF